MYTHLQECKIQNGYPSNARHKIFDLKAIIFNLALRLHKLYPAKNISLEIILLPSRGVLSRQQQQQGSDLQEDHCLPAEQQLNASQSRRLQKSQSAHIKSHGFSLYLSFFAIIQRSVEG